LSQNITPKPDNKIIFAEIFSKSIMAAISARQCYPRKQCGFTYAIYIHWTTKDHVGM